MKAEIEQIHSEGEKKSEFKEPNPLSKAGLLSQLFFTWIVPMLKRGKDEYLSQKMHHDLRSKDKAVRNYELFTKHWMDCSPKTHPLFRALIRCNKALIMVFLFSGFIYYVFSFSTPLILNRVIYYAGTDNKDVGMIIGIVLIIFFTRIFLTISYSLRAFFGDFVALYITTSISMEIFAKTLKFPILRSKSFNSGKIVNLLQVDLTQINTLFDNLLDILFIPFQIIAGVILMYYYVGVSFLSGIGMIIVFAIVQYVGGIYYNKYQEEMMKVKDKRMKATTEALNSIKFIKMNSLEKYFLQRICKTRESELDVLRKERYLDMFNIFFYWLTPMMVTSSTFLTYILMGETLTPIQAFTIVSTFLVLGQALRGLPNAIAELINAHVSIKRIEEFLKSEEIEKEYIKTDADGREGDLAIVIKGDFLWEKGSDSEKDDQKEKKNAKEENEKNLKKKKEVKIKNAAKTESKKRAQSDASGSSELTTKLLNINDSVDESKEIDLSVSGDMKSEDETTPEEESTTVHALKSIEIRIRKKAFVAIVGEVGSGKSSIVSALLADMKSPNRQQQTAGMSYPAVSINGSLAYVSQKPWIQNMTVKNNILFGSEFEESKFKKIVELCCLEPDFAMWPKGEDTMIGEKGVNCSGGQKARISLARALYSDNEIIVLDDILSAVDAHVGSSIFKNALKTHLSQKTRVLITHAVQYLTEVDYIYVIDKGEVILNGKYEEISENEIFKKIMEKLDHIRDDASEPSARLNQEEPKFEEIEESKEDIQLEDYPRSNGASRFPEDAIHRELSPNPSEKSSNTIDCSVQLNFNPALVDSSPKELSTDNEVVNELMLQEDREVGRVKWKVYKAYAQLNGGYAFFFAVFFVMFCWLATSLGSNIWLAYWTDQKESSQNSLFYIGIYAALAISYAFFCLIRCYMLFMKNLVCSRHLHRNIMTNLLLAPLNQFFDRVPIGRILNRLSKDICFVDYNLSFALGTFIVNLYSVMGDFGMCAYAINFWIIPPMAFFFGIVFYIQQIFMASNRELTRLESISRSSIISTFTESIHGLSTIRAFGKQDFTFKKFAHDNDELTKNRIAITGFKCWFIQRIAFASLFMICFTTFFCLYWEMVPAKAAMVLTYVFMIEEDITYALSAFSFLELRMISFERCYALCSLPQENGYKFRIDDMPEEEKRDFPKRGGISFEELYVKYRPELDFVLRDFSLNVRGGEKIGIVGRTGSGKSTLGMTLLRYLDASSGRIIVDGTDITELDLRIWRDCVTTIPQDPHLFEGSLRSNVDPANQYTDAQILEALERTCLSERFKEKGLESEIKENGDNVSAGEKQLICIAQAILKSNKIVLIDEATANLDIGTDRQIQKVIRANFSNSTVLTIAHRIDTILDSDRVIVLEKGRIVEVGEPSMLLSRKNSKFYGLWKEAKLKNSTH